MTLEVELFPSSTATQDLGSMTATLANTIGTFTRSKVTGFGESEIPGDYDKDDTTFTDVHSGLGYFFGAGNAFTPTAFGYMQRTPDDVFGPTGGIDLLRRGDLVQLRGITNPTSSPTFTDLTPQTTVPYEKIWWDPKRLTWV